MNGCLRGIFSNTIQNADFTPCALSPMILHFKAEKRRSQFCRRHYKTFRVLKHHQCDCNTLHFPQFLNGVAPIRRQAINCNDDAMYWRIYASFSFDEFTAIRDAYPRDELTWYHGTRGNTSGTTMATWALSQYKDRLIYVWWFPC